MNILIILTIPFAFLFFLSNHPLSMIMHLILISLLLALTLSSILSYPWFSYILILILLGAMLIIFLYMATLAPNELLSWNTKPLMLMILTTPLLYMMFPHMKANFISSSTLFNKNPHLLTIITAIYLLITMIAIVKISTPSQGPIKSN